MKLHLLLVASLLAAASAQARLRETIEECLDRYGKPIDVRVESMSAVFQKAGITVIVYFDEHGLADFLHYQSSTSKPISQSQAKVIAASSMAQPLVEAAEDDGVIWGDLRERFAFFDRKKSMLYVFTGAGGRRIMDFRQQLEGLRRR